MMQILFNLRMKESASVASHINDFDSLIAQICAQRINIDDEMKEIFLLCLLPPSWDIFCTAVSNSTPNGTLVYIDVTSSILSKEMHLYWLWCRWSIWLSFMGSGKSINNP
ncbi:hypothetical protein L7F22_063549 [Adiantum nelumboides]|nr:hypothetical protein [Adiantum nelumboides]